MRILDIADGFTSATAPTITSTTSASLIKFANDAAFEAVYTPDNGNLYYNTTSHTARIYVNGGWQEFAIFEA